MRRSIVSWLGLLVPAWCAGASLAVDVVDARGRAVPDAVIELRALDGQAVPAAPAARTKVIDQKDELFVPYVETFRPGDAVAFSNSDDTRHHVYSFSPQARFEFLLAPGEHSSPQRLDAAGDIAVGCNIHDHMVTYLFVSEAPWVARSDERGRVVFADLPDGAFRLSAWHPQQKPGATPPPREVVAGAAASSERVVFTLLPDPRGERDLEQVDY